MSDWSEKYFGSDLLEYKIVEGTLWFSYSLNDRQHKETVPAHLINTGIDAIEVYVRERISKVKEEVRKKQARCQRKIAATDVPVTLVHDGIEITGHIKYAPPRYAKEHASIKVILETPEKYAEGREERESLFGGIEMFTDEGEVSASAIERARKILIEIYEKKKKRLVHPLLHDLADKLNKRR